MPYSVSMPQILVTATGPTLPSGRAEPGSARRPRPAAATRSEVLPGPHPLYRPAAARLLGVGEQGANVDDALALLARYPGPVVGVGGVGQVLVLLVLPADGLHQVRDAHPVALAGDGALDRQLLRPSDDVLDHGARGEV